MSQNNLISRRLLKMGNKMYIKVTFATLLLIFHFFYFFLVEVIMFCWEWKVLRKAMSKNGNTRHYLSFTGLEWNISYYKMYPFCFWGKQMTIPTSDSLYHDLSRFLMTVSYLQNYILFDDHLQCSHWKVSWAVDCFLLENP